VGRWACYPRFPRIPPTNKLDTRQQGVVVWLLASCKALGPGTLSQSDHGLRSPAVSFHDDVLVTRSSEPANVITLLTITPPGLTKQVQGRDDRARQERENREGKLSAEFQVKPPVIPLPLLSSFFPSFPLSHTHTHIFFVSDNDHPEFISFPSLKTTTIIPHLNL